jgi:hypothetical protein
MQKSLAPRNAAKFCISTETAPWAKPSQKLTAAVPTALSGVDSAELDQIGRRPGSEIRFRGSLGDRRCEQHQRGSDGPFIQCHDYPSLQTVVKHPYTPPPCSAKSIRI